MPNQWRHGWIPLTASAAKSKNHGKKPKPGSAVAKQVGGKAGSSGGGERLGTDATGKAVHKGDKPGGKKPPAKPSPKAPAKKIGWPKKQSPKAAPKASDDQKRAGFDAAAKALAQKPDTPANRKAMAELARIRSQFVK
jgi:hypothetical protein